MGKMEFRKTGWPEVGDLVIATVKRITDYGAYVTLDEYEKEGLLHISELSSRWVRNIRSFIREGQKVVLKVLRVDAEKEHVDLSLRRVTKRERKEKILSWKKERKADTLLRTASEKLKMPPEEFYKKIEPLLEKEFEEIHEELEKAAREGAGVLTKAGIPEDIAIILEEVAKEKIKLPMVSVKGILNLQCTKSNGVIAIREALLSTQKIQPKNAKIEVYAVAPPKYRIVVSAEDYKAAEKILEKAINTVVRNITEAGGQGTFIREK
jgi:translation initiation factor 2 subunit 1